MSWSKGLALASSLVVVVGLSASAAAQDIVPGGWSQQFHHQSLGSVTMTPGGMNSWGTGWGGSNVAYSPSGVYRASNRQATGFSGYGAPARTVNMLVPLGDVIRRNTHSRRSR